MSVRPVLESDLCFIGAYCAHAVLTVHPGRYRCPFGGSESCFKRAKKEPEHKP